MRLDLLVKLKDEQRAIKYLLVLDILSVTYFFTSITIHDLQTSDMRQIR